MSVEDIVDGLAIIQKKRGRIVDQGDVEMLALAIKELRKGRPGTAQLAEAVSQQDTKRIDLLAEITDSSVRRDVFGGTLKADEQAALLRAAEALSVGYEVHRRTKDTPEAFRAAVDDALSGPSVP